MTTNPQHRRAPAPPCPGCRSAGEHAREDPSPAYACMRPACRVILYAPITAAHRRSLHEADGSI